MFLIQAKMESNPKMQSFFLPLSPPIQHGQVKTHAGNYLLDGITSSHYVDRSSSLTESEKIRNKRGIKKWDDVANEQVQLWRNFVCVTTMWPVPKRGQLYLAMRFSIMNRIASRVFCLLVILGFNSDQGKLKNSTYDLSSTFTENCKRLGCIKRGNFLFTMTVQRLKAKSDGFPQQSSTWESFTANPGAQREWRSTHFTPWNEGKTATRGSP